MATPTVSVIIPTCNRLDMLERSVSSVLAQTLQPLEIIVVNDAGVAVEPLLASLDRKGIIRSATHTTNKGASAARNTGLAMARGDYIAYLDDDDLYLPEHLASVVPQLAASDCRFGYAFAEYVIDDMKDGVLVNVGRVQPYTGIAYSRDRLLVANFIPTPTWVFARSLIEDVGTFDESFAACEDWEWLIRASEKTEFLAVPVLTVEVRQRLYDQQHLILQHRPQMAKWIAAVYAKHPVASPSLKLARQEHGLFGAAKDLTAEEQQLVDAAFDDDALDLVGLFNAAAVLEGANRRHRAVDLYRQWLARSAAPLRHPAAYNLAVVLQNLGQPREAEAAYRQALELEPRFTLARMQLASLLEHRGEVDGALDCWRAVVRQERASGSAEHAQAAAHLRRFLDA